jgi:hypothetical protein
MVRTFAILILVAVVFASAARAQTPTPVSSDPPVLIAMPNSDVSDVLKFYASLSRRKVWVELGLTSKISVVSHGTLPRAEALSLIRDRLREEGIEIREVGDSEAFVSRVMR